MGKRIALLLNMMALFSLALLGCEVEDAQSKVAPSSTF